MTDDLIDSGVRDGRGRLVTLTAITDDNWRAVADVVPRDDQREFVPPSAARYLLLSSREGVWHSLGICADEAVVGHVMWGFDPDDGAHWVGGLLVDAARQGEGVGRAALTVLLAWLEAKPDFVRARLSYRPENAAARKLYASLGFVELDLVEDDEVVAELVR
ncbi:diamine N-acetyltransferase [Lentzea fradiae]|uniref:Diamine N-acetyltransferase n=1 Tax=Lentzea fradiae TaxID=200378 RepID=A0A1G7W120_9PSEU|nr:GNAT family N-acetyltransferase [Lentzea fradiae]SDG65558.1 diamine N-acetyltransferase [Lentzea fradiae]